MNKEYSDSFARFYDTIYNQLRDSVDNDFFINKVKETKGKILEVGVGTGRFFAEVLFSNSDIYGIDISSSMLNILKSKIPDNQHFRISKQGIVDFNFDFKFDLIIAPFRVFMHLLDKKEQLDALNNVCKHLNKDGLFIFDTFIPNFKHLLNGLDNVKDFEGEYKPNKILKRFASTVPDISNQIIKVVFKFEWEDDDNILSDSFNTQLRYFFRYELEHLLERSLFGNYKIYGDYKLNQLTDTSTDYVMFCYK